MAIDSDLARLSEEAIDEHIEFARICISTRKIDGEIDGYPMTLLRFCVIDAMSWHLGYADYSLGALNDPISEEPSKGISSN